eukprot:350722-Pleurochrysis_carterae.AAC.1
MAGVAGQGAFSPSPRALLSSPFLMPLTTTVYTLRPTREPNGAATTLLADDTAQPGQPTLANTPG